MRTCMHAYTHIQYIFLDRLSLECNDAAVSEHQIEQYIVLERTICSVQNTSIVILNKQEFE